MKVQNVEDLMYVGMTYVLDFENRLSAGAQTMAQAASDPQVKEMFEKSVTQGRKYAERVQSAFGKLGKQQQTNENHLAIAMVREVQGMISNTDQGPVRDAALIVAFNQQQAYRVASYGSLRHYAELIGKQDAVQELQQSLEEAKAGDEKLTLIGEQKINPRARDANAVAA
jgi:ferritin-like metal-binding protein YciE